MFVLQSDSNTQVFVYPEFDFEERNEQKTQEHRTGSGRMYFYLWGQWKAFKMSVNYVNSSDRTTINSWWMDRTELQFYPFSTPTDVSSVIITNNKLPLGKFQKPYLDLWEGDIELETY